MDQGFSLEDIPGIIRRRWPLAVAPTILFGVLSTGVAFVLPPTYSSTARILVESQQIPEDLARSTVTSGPTERIRLIEQRLTTRRNLLDIARRFGIYADRPDLTPTEIVQLMQKATTIEDVVLAVQNRTEVTATAVNITFRANRAVLASQVANEFVSQVLEQNIQQRNARASETLSFFNGEVARLADQIGALETRIAAFKRENEAALPASLGFRQSQFATLLEGMFDRESRRIAIEQRIRSLRDQIAAGQLESGLTAEQEELRRLRQQLIQQRAVLADTHPTIRQLTLRIAALESDGALDEDAVASPAVALAQAELDALTQQLTLLEQQIAADSEKLEGLQASIDRTPAVEIELSALERQMDNLQLQYEQALLKQAEAATGERLEVNRQAERFEVIDQAETPARPDSPNRPLIAAAGFVGGAGIGAALMLLFELMNRYIRSPRDLERQVNLRPIVTIPYISTRREVRRRVWTIRLGVFCIIVLAPLTLYAIDQFYQPLPLIAERLAIITGLDAMIAILESRFGK